MDIDQEWSVYFNGRNKSLTEYKLEELSKIASEKNGTLISTTYGGSYEKLEFKCNNVLHPSFMIRPNDVKQGKWCAKCGKTGKKSDNDLTLLISKIGGVFITNQRIRVNNNTRNMITFTCKNGHQAVQSLSNINRAIAQKSMTAGCDKCRKFGINS
jgi:hypothetical protein